MKTTNKTLSLILSILIISAMCACNFDESKRNLSGGELVDNERISAIKNEILSGDTETDSAESKVEEIDSSILEAYPDSGEIVYWTESGEVWHKSTSCTHIKEDSELYAGTVTAAVEAGKSRPCGRCFD